MKKLLTLGFWSCFLFISLPAVGQSSIGFDSSFVITFPDTVIQNDTAGFVVRLKNYGPSQIDTVRIYSGYKNNQGFISGVAQEAFYTSGSVLAIPPNSTITGRAVIQFSPNRFPLGIDVVVIWPKATNAITADTLEFNPLVITPFAAENLLRDYGFKVYPSPFTNLIHIQSTIGAERIRVYNLSGDLIYAREFDETINLSDLPEATYLLEIAFKNGTRRFVKVIKSNSKN